ncbi:MAG TPA: hypothetical protein VGV13_13725 [Methylomirabilota bacterium]|nr:hypothetical protein [Methylomirabilota bacterium]
MPHYRDGTEANVGDVVRGRGYNIGHEIIGKVLSITPGAETCNLSIACIAAPSVIYRADVGHGVQVVPTIEYGEAAAFEKVG